MALLLAFGGVGFVVPAAIGDPPGQQADQGLPPGHGPDGAGPPGQLKKLGGGSGNASGQGDGNGQGNGDGNGQGNGNGNGQGNGNGNDQGNGNGNGNDQGAGNNQPPAPAQGAPAQVAQTVNHGHGNGPNGAGPPGQLKKVGAGGGNGNGDGQGNGNGNGNGRGHGHGHGNGNGNTAAPAQPAGTANTASATPAPAPAAPAPVTPARTIRSGIGSRHRFGGGHPRSSAGRSGASGRSVARSIPAPTAGGAGTITLTRGAGSGPLSSDLGSTGSGSGSGAAPIVAGPLAPGTAQIGRGGAAVSGTRSSTAGASAHRARRNNSLGTSTPDPAGTVIEHFINVIPIGVWLALAAALALAALAGVAALRSGRRVRIQAGEVAAVTAAALTDPLTGIMNRRGFIEAAERELLRAHRYDHPVALAFVDIRGLKSVNDTEGHLAGDRLLRRVTMLLRDSARTHDLVGRIGGDEMAVLLAEQSVDGAAAMIQRVRAQVPSARHSLGFATPWDVTIGTAAYPEDGDTFEELLAAADRRLYEQRGIRLT